MKTHKKGNLVKVKRIDIMVDDNTMVNLEVNTIPKWWMFWKWKIKRQDFVRFIFNDKTGTFEVE